MIQFDITSNDQPCVFPSKLQLLRNFDFTIVMVLFTFSFSMLALFLYCYFGMTATENYEKMADSLYGSNWIGLPVKLQKYVILMIMYGQKPLYYHGFHVVVVNLETYTNVSNCCKND